MGILGGENGDVEIFLGNEKEFCLDFGFGCGFVVNFFLSCWKDGMRC